MSRTINAWKRFLLFWNSFWPGWSSIHHTEVSYYPKFSNDSFFYRWFIILFNSFVVSGLHEQMEFKNECNINACKTFDGFPGLLQLLFQCLSLRHWCIKRWLILPTFITRVKFHYLRSSKWAKQYDQKQLFNTWYYKEF